MPTPVSTPSVSGTFLSAPSAASFEFKSFFELAGNILPECLPGMFGVSHKNVECPLHHPFVQMKEPFNRVPNSKSESNPCLFPLVPIARQMPRLAVTMTMCVIVPMTFVSPMISVPSLGQFLLFRLLMLLLGERRSIVRLFWPRRWFQSGVMRRLISVNVRVRCFCFCFCFCSFCVTMLNNNIRLCDEYKIPKRILECSLLRCMRCPLTLTIRCLDKVRIFAIAWLNSLRSFDGDTFCCEIIRPYLYGLATRQSHPIALLGDIEHPMFALNDSLSNSARFSPWYEALVRFSCLSGRIWCHFWFFNSFLVRSRHSLFFAIRDLENSLVDGIIRRYGLGTCPGDAFFREIGGINGNRFSSGQLHLICLRMDSIFDETPRTRSFRPARNELCRFPRLPFETHK